MGLPFHPLWLIILLAIVLIIFGPGKLPELGGAVGRGIREFRKASSEVTDEVRSSMERKDPPAAPVTVVPPVTTVPAEHAAETETTSPKS